MKKILFTTIILLAISCNQKETPKPGEVLLSGKIEGLKKGTIYIQKFLDTAMVIKDSIIFSGQDTFSTKINIIEPQMLSLFLDRGQTESMDNSLQFFAEPGEMNLKTSLK